MSHGVECKTTNQKTRVRNFTKKKENRTALHIQLKNNYALPQIKTNFGKQLFQYIGPRLWKEEPSKLKTLPLKSFKKHCKKHLLSCYAK